MRPHEGRLRCRISHGRSLFSIVEFISASRTSSSRTGSLGPTNPEDPVLRNMKFGCLTLAQDSTMSSALHVDFRSGISSDKPDMDHAEHLNKLQKGGRVSPSDKDCLDLRDEEFERKTM